MDPKPSPLAVDDLDGVAFARPDPVEHRLPRDSETSGGLGETPGSPGDRDGDGVACED